MFELTWLNTLGLITSIAVKYKGGGGKLCDFGFARAMSINTLVLTSIKVRKIRASLNRLM